MHPEIKLIAQSIPDWKTFVSHVNETIHRSPTRSLDAAGIPVGPAATFVAALGEMVKVDSNPIRILQDSDYLLEHLSYTFFISCDQEALLQLLLLSTKIHVDRTDTGRHRENFIATATLKVWRDMIVESCQRDSAFEVRMVASVIWEILDKLGFREIFGKFHRKALNDRTFVLEAPGR